MITKDDVNRAFNLGTLFLPGTSLLILLAAAVVISMEMSRNSQISPALSSDEITDIEFLSQRTAQSMTAAVVTACDVTGCDGPAVATMIRASVPEMTATELTDVIAASERSVADLKHRLDFASDRTATRALTLQVAAESEIAALYRAELRQRN